MIREWFDTRDVVAFAREIARDLNRMHPTGNDARNPNPTKKDRKKLDSIILRTRTFAQQRDLNVYKKAKLLNTIKWELRDAGQDPALIDEIIASLTPLLGKVKKA